MATTIKQSFAELRRNLEITDLQASTVSTRQSKVREVMEDGMTVLDSFLVGSYQRNTMIRPLKEADVDIFVVLDPKYYDPSGYASLLDKVKGTLRKAYETPDISRNGQAVTIFFSDFRVDVVPAFNRTGGGYLIPNSVLKQWISTHPKVHIDQWASENKAHGGDLVPLLKMLKAWNRENGSLMTSFHLETLALKILTGVTISDFWSGARYVFDKARTVVPYPVLDPAGYGGNVGAYLNTAAKVSDVVSHLETAYSRAVSAEELESKGKTSEAVAKWRLVFGSYFPAYG